MKKKDSALSCLNFMIEQTQFLASEYDVQYKELHALSDYATWDLASDWIWDDTKATVKNLEKNSLITEKGSRLIQEICLQFRMLNDNEDLCTLHALKNNVFWENQRERAKQLLDELKMIKSKIINSL